MKKVTKPILSFLLLTTLANAAIGANSGSYAGIGFGDTRFQTPNKSLFNVNTPSENFFVNEEEKNGKPSLQPSGMGGRLFGGYNFNSYFGVETGLAHYVGSKYMGNMGTAQFTQQYNMNAIDLMLKAYLPFGNGRLNLYASGALAHTRAMGKDNSGDWLSLDDLTIPTDGTATHNKMRPVIGIGTSYDIPRTDFTTGIEFNRFQGSDIKTSSDAVPSSDMLTFNLSYHLD